MSGIVRQNESDQTWVIADNATESTGYIKTKGLAGGGFRLPTGTVSANWTYKVSEDGTNFATLKDATGETCTATACTAGDAVEFPSAIFGWLYAKLVSSASQTGGPLTIPVVLQG